MIHKIAKTRVELAIDNIKPKVLADVIKALEYAGYDHYMILDSQDCDEILELGGWVEEGYIHFNFNDIASHPRASHHIRTLMKHLKRIKRERNAKMSIRW